MIGKKMWQTIPGLTHTRNSTSVYLVPVFTLLTSAPVVFPRIFPLVFLTTSTSGPPSSVTALTRPRSS